MTHFIAEASDNKYGVYHNGTDEPLEHRFIASFTFLSEAAMFVHYLNGGTDPNAARLVLDQR